MGMCRVGVRVIVWGFRRWLRSIRGIGRLGSILRCWVVEEVMGGWKKERETSIPGHYSGENGDLTHIPQNYGIWFFTISCIIMKPTNYHRSPNTLDTAFLHPYT